MNTNLFILFALFMGLQALATHEGDDLDSSGGASKGAVVYEKFPYSEEEKKNWNLLTCSSEGVCTYQNKKTKQEIFVKSEIVQVEAKVGAKVENKEISNWASFEKIVNGNNKLGKRFFIVKVGEKNNCGLCRDLDKKLEESPLAKNPQVEILNFDYGMHKGSDFEGYLVHTLKWNRGNYVNYPVVFIIESAPDGNPGHSRLDPGQLSINGSISAKPIEEKMKIFFKDYEEFKKKQKSK